MGLIKEPKNVDFYLEGRDMTEEEKIRVSNFIRQQREQQNLKVSNIRLRAKKKILV